MLGYMNEEAYNKSRRRRASVTFYSRYAPVPLDQGRDQRPIGSTVVSVAADCDNDTLLDARAIPARPDLPHGFSKTCFGDGRSRDRRASSATCKASSRGATPRCPKVPTPRSSSTRGVNKIAQKVGEEAVETVIEADRRQQPRRRSIYEASDLIYHLLVLLEATGCSIADLEKELARRHS